MRFSPIGEWSHPAAWTYLTESRVARDLSIVTDKVFIPATASAANNIRRLTFLAEPLKPLVALQDATISIGGTESHLLHRGAPSHRASRCVLGRLGRIPTPNRISQSDQDPCSNHRPATGFYRSRPERKT